MILRNLELNDVLIVNDKAYKRVHRFDCEDSSGEPYYWLEGENPFIKFSGREPIEHFSNNVYILIKE